MSKYLVNQESLYNVDYLQYWQAEIVTFRTQIELKLTTNLKQYLESRLDYLYSKARKIAELKSCLSLPAINPYNLEQVLDTDWFPEI
jgi:hypothetical protein